MDTARTDVNVVVLRGDRSRVHAPAADREMAGKTNGNPNGTATVGSAGFRYGCPVVVLRKISELIGHYGLTGRRRLSKAPRDHHITSMIFAGAVRADS